MKIPPGTKEKLLALRAKLPRDCRGRFVEAFRRNLPSVELENTIGCAILGAMFGAVMEILPGMETLTGIDDWVEVGAAVGAWVGYARDRRDHDEKQQLHELIEEALRHALATDQAVIVTPGDAQGAA